MAKEFHRRVVRKKKTVRIKLPVISINLNSIAMRSRRWRSLYRSCYFHQSVVKTEVTINMKSSRAKFSDISFASGFSNKEQISFLPSHQTNVMLTTSFTSFSNIFMKNESTTKITVELNSFTHSYYMLYRRILLGMFD